MDQSPHRYVSALLSLPPASLWRRGSAAWKSTFPFSASHGGWAFSGRVALALGLRALGLPRGSTILVPAYFQGTEIDTLLRAGYKLKFYRLQRNFEVDLNDVEAKLTPQVAALYVIHYFGLPQPLAELERFARERNIKFIEDCALALFSCAGDVPLGSRGDLSIFSVYKTVPLPHGGYGVIKTPGEFEQLPPPPFAATVNQTLDLMVDHLKSSSGGVPFRRTRRALGLLRRPLRWERGTTIESGSVRWDSRMMRYGVSRLVERLMGLASPEEVVAARRRNFSRLHRRLRRFSPLAFDALPDGACPLFYPIVVADKNVAQRTLEDRGIGSVNLWSEDHTACPKELRAEVAPWRRHILELPVHHLLDESGIERVGQIAEHCLDHRMVRGDSWTPDRNVAFPT